MDNPDEWCFIEHWDGPLPDEMIEEIQQKAKEHIGEVDKVIHSLNKVVRSCRDWERKVLFSLCVNCRAKCSIKNTVKTKAECPTKTKKTSFLSLVSHFSVKSGHNDDQIHDQDSPRVSMSKNTTRKGSKSPVDENHPTKEDLQCLLETKESAFRNYDQKTELEMKKLRSDIDKLEEDNKLLQTRLSSVVRDRDQAQGDTARAVMDTENVASEMRTLSEEWEVTRQRLTEIIADLTNQITQQTKQIASLESNLDTKDEELRMVQIQLVEANRPRTKDIVLGIRSERSGMGKTMVEMVTRELTGQLQNTLVRENVRLAVKSCQAATDVPRGMLAVLCLDMSRVGTNIRDALAGITANRDVFVIVFHHTNKENLSSLTPTSLRITGSDLRQLGAIIDMVFSSDGGIYECDLNNTAVANIAALISKYS